jgi:fructokinase
MKISDEETELLTGIKEPEAAAKKLLEQGVKVVAVTLGSEGALVGTKEGSKLVPGYKANMVDTTGAGDSFWGGFLNQFIESGKKPCEVTLDEAAAFAKFGNAAASLCVEKRGAIPAMPTLEDVAGRI